MAELHLDRLALERLVRQRAADYSKSTAEAIAERVREQGITVGDRDGGKYEIALPVRVYANEARAEAVAVLAHPAGIAVEQKHRSLRRAAAALGLEIDG